MPRIVQPCHDPETIAPFVAAAKRLQAAGASVLVTSCGFLWPAADRIAQSVSIPVVVSALEAVSRLRKAAGPNRPIGIMTFDGGVLSQSPLGALDPGPLVIEGIETGRELHRVIAGDLESLDEALANEDVAAAAKRLKARAPDLFAVVLECTNLPPYRATVEAVAGVRVVDAVDLIIEHVGTSADW